MIDYTISETYELPSRGKVYGVDVSPEVTLKSMTVNHEMLRLSASEYPYKVMSEILDDCILTDTKISTYDMCIADYTFLLHKLRIVTYGASYDISSFCPFCGFENSRKFSLEDLEVLELEEDNNPLDFTEFKLEKTGVTVKLKLQTPRMLDSIQKKIKEMKKKLVGTNQDPTVLITVMESIDEVDGKKPSFITLEQWVRSLPMLDVQNILAHIEKSNSCIGIQTAIENVCPTCGYSYLSSFRSTAEFFRPSLDI